MDIDKSFQIATCVASEPLPVRPTPSCPTSDREQVAECQPSPDTEEAFRIIRSIAGGNPVADSQSTESVLSALCVVIAHIAGPPEIPSAPPPAQCSISERGTKSLDDYLAEIERREVLLALEATGRNAAQAAKLLGISYRSMRYRLENLGIE